MFILQVGVDVVDGKVGVVVHMIDYKSDGRALDGRECDNPLFRILANNPDKDNPDCEIMFKFCFDFLHG